MDQAFRDAIATGYTIDEPAVVIGSAMHDGELLDEIRVQGAPEDHRYRAADREGS